MNDHDEQQRSNEPPPRDYYKEKLDRWREEWNRELDRDLEEGK